MPYAAAMAPSQAESLLLLAHSPQAIPLTVMAELASTIKNSTNSFPWPSNPKPRQRKV